MFKRMSFLLFLLVIFVFNINARITLIDTVKVANQARDCVWSEDGVYFAIPNKNGLVDSNEVQIWEMDWDLSDGPNKDWDFPGCRVLDYGWNGKYLAIAGYSDSTIVIYDIELDDTWYDNIVKVIDVMKCHQLEWVHNGDFLVYEILDESQTPDDSDLGVFDCSSLIPSDWKEARIIETPGETDKLRMSANNGWLSYESKNESGEYKVHIWDISESKPTYWHQEYVKENQKGGSFSPAGSYFVTKDAYYDTVYIYKTSNGVLERQIIAQGDGPVFHPDSNGLVDGSICLAGDLLLTTINISNWTVEYNIISIKGEGCSFNPGGSYLSIYEGFSGNICGIYDFKYCINVEQVPDKHLNIAVSPNPFSSEIYFYIDAKINWEMFIYDIKGRLVRKFDVAGNRISWNGKNEDGTGVASGIYFCRVVGNNFEETVKIIKLD